MSESKSLFAAVIEEHLALKRRNAHLNGQRPLSAYEVEDPLTGRENEKTKPGGHRGDAGHRAPTAGTDSCSASMRLRAVRIRRRGRRARCR